MPITAADIQLIESERMTDTADGGGRRTARVIPDGTGIFDKVSRLAATYGRVNLRKIYGAVSTADTDTYAGAHVIITDPPDNNRIGVCLFSTRSDFDLRADAQDRVESYVVYGPESRLRLFGRQPVGAKAVLAYQREEETLPEIGDVYALVQEDVAGAILATQYIRVDSIAHEVREFEDDKGLYRYRIITLGITAPITWQFSGSETPVRSSAQQRLGKIRSTSVADAAAYYGIQPLAEPVTAGALSVRVPSIYHHIVPTTQRETALSLVEIGGARNYLASGATYADNLNSVRPFFFPTGILPGSVTWEGVSDDGQGSIDMSSVYGAGKSAAIDYDSGTLTPNFSFGSQNNSLSAESALSVSSPAHTRSIDVTIANRGSLYSVVLSPVPAPGTLSVDYRALGKWYRLRDAASLGTLEGSEPSYGTGTVDYINGSAVVTLGALPDTESAVLFSWGSPVHYEERFGATSDADLRCSQQIQLAHAPIQANSLTLTFRYGASNVQIALSSSNTGSNVNIQAAVDPITGLVSIQYPGTLPDPGSTIAATYQSLQDAGGESVIKTNTTAVGGFTSTIELAEGISPGSVKVLLPMAGIVITTGDGWVSRSIFDGTVECYDDGSGALKVRAGQSIPERYGRPAARLADNAVVGAINYGAGSISVTGAVACTSQAWQTPLGIRPGQWVQSTGNISRYESIYSSPASKPAVTTYLPAGASTVNASRTESFTFDSAPLRVDLTKSTGNPVIPGSVAFYVGLNQQAVDIYTDRSGTLVRAIDPFTGSATAAGSIDYAAGIARISDWSAVGLQAGITVMSCITGRGEFVADAAFFRTSGSPVRPGSLYVQVTAEDGTQITGTSDVSGQITGDLCEGTIQQDMGVVSVRFGEWMPVTGNEAQPWFDADLIDPDDSTRVWKPARALPSTLRYSAIVTSNVALDSSILGLDPVRLPLDGRVPIFRPGDVAVVHNTQSVTLPNPPTAGATYTVGRGSLSDLWIVSAANTRIDPALYTVDLDAGSVTMASPLDLTGVSLPLVAKHRVEDMLLVADVRIDGTIESAGPVSRSYATEGTYVSSALLFNDLAARVSNVFDQGTWTGIWSDSALGGAASAQYNDILYPIEVTNAGAITERWRINFTNPTTFQIIGENSGVIATGTTGADAGPINPLTLEPYFVIRAGGWGSGWSVGNQLRFNTAGAAAPIWAARTILPGAALTGDSINLQLRGDIDA